MFDLFQESLEGQTFDCVEEYDAEVLRISRNAQEELGKAERFYLSETGRKEFINESGGL